MFEFISDRNIDSIIKKCEIMGLDAKQMIEEKCDDKMPEYIKYILTKISGIHANSTRDAVYGKETWRRETDIELNDGRILRVKEVVEIYSRMKNAGIRKCMESKSSITSGIVHNSLYITIYIYNEYGEAGILKYNYDVNEQDNQILSIIDVNELSNIVELMLEEDYDGNNMNSWKSYTINLRNVQARRS